MAHEGLRQLDLLLVPHAEDPNTAFKETKELLLSLAATGYPPNLVLTPEEARRRMSMFEASILAPIKP